LDILLFDTHSSFYRLSELIDGVSFVGLIQGNSQKGATYELCYSVIDYSGISGTTVLEFWASAQLS